MKKKKIASPFYVWLGLTGGHFACNIKRRLNGIWEKVTVLTVFTKVLCNRAFIFCLTNNVEFN